jgi:hypothetical protein
MKIILFFALFFTINTNLFAQKYADNVRVACVCEAHKYRLSSTVKYTNDFPIVVFAPVCSSCKSRLEGDYESITWFKKRKKTKHKHNTGSRIIWL